MGRAEVIKADIAELRAEKVAALRRVEAALQDEALAQPVTFATDDLREGLAATREKRTPNFTGT